MKLQQLLLLCLSGLAATVSAAYITPAPRAPEGCILGGSDCPPGSSCTQTMTCGGLCITSPPPPLPCTVGASKACPTGSTCTPSSLSCPPTGPCDGLCIDTPPPQIPCTMGGCNECPTGSTCTPTMQCPETGACGGACLATPTGLPTKPCVLGAGDCPTPSFCTPTMVCSGQCRPTATPPPGHCNAEKRRGR